MNFAMRLLLLMYFLVHAAPGFGQCSAQWLPSPAELQLASSIDPPIVNALLTADLDGDGPDRSVLLVGGSFLAAGGIPACNIAAWDGAAWRSFGSPGAPGAPGFGPPPVLSMIVFQGELVIGTEGWFQSTDPGRVLHHTGERWLQLGSNAPRTVRAMTIYEGNLIAAGDTLKRWDGSTWSTLSSASTGGVYALAVHAGQLYAGGLGTFPTPGDGGTAAQKVARWDGAYWRPVANNTMPNGVRSLLSTGVGLIAGCNAGNGTPIYTLSADQWLPAAPCVSCGTPVQGYAIANVGDSLYIAGTQRSPETGGIGARLVSGAWVRTPAAPHATTFAVAAFNNQIFFGGVGGFYRHVLPTADFNNDGVPNDLDIESFFACLGGDCCPGCLTPDLNGDGDSGTDQDIEAFFRLLSGQPC